MLFINIESIMSLKDNHPLKLTDDYLFNKGFTEY